MLPTFNSFGSKMQPPGSGAMLMLAVAIMGCIGAEACGQEVAVASEPAVSFNRDVRPILAANCYLCHGPDAATRKADLRLDDRAAAIAEDAAAIVPGKPEESALVARILATSDDEIMPPPDSKKKLTDAQKEILRRWIAQGAKYEKHWSFESVVKSAPPEGMAPHPIDAFLLARSGAAGLVPQPEADRHTLIRRAAFTLTGLPPTIAEVDAFVNDADPAAYEKMVDRYLASPRYGEEMARHWLDVARYADTHGLHLDNERQMWAYRDWVVQAFNDNLPFDQFTIWQVAGDLLPEPTTEQLVATGFNRCNVTTSEGGSIPEEFTYRYAVERTTAVAQTWLGLTAGCAVCHDHKYDPLTMREFYSLYAFFNSAADPAMDGNINTTPPFLRLPTPKQKAAAEAAGKVEGEARAWLETLAAHASYVDPAGAASAGAESAGAESASAPQPPARRAVREVLLDEALPIGAVSRSSSRNAVEWIADAAPSAASGRRAIRQAMAANYTDTFEFKLRPIVVPHEATVEFWLRVEPLSLPISVTLHVSGGQPLVFSAAEGGMKRAGSQTIDLPAGEWKQFVIPAAELGLKAGAPITSVALSQNGGIAYWDGLALAGHADPAADPLQSLSAWRKALGAAVPPELPGELHPLIQRGADKELAANELEKLRRFYVAFVARPLESELSAARGAWEAARTARLIAEESPPGTFIYKELAAPRDSFIMLRGQYDRPGDKVEPSIPSALGQLLPAEPGKRLTRLDLAHWLVSAENPLAARVTVNRLWQQAFGAGLVKTSYDFGSQGASPSHPELLDWLAAEYRESGWNTKQFMKMLMMSQAFRRQAVATPESLAIDPANRFLARGPRLRLAAEQARDNALFVSGLMNFNMGGPGVKPYQPPNIWEPVGYSDSNTRFYLQDHGPDLYRRSLYTFLKRTAPPPFMSNFDGPNREQVCQVRERSNTPLQALQLMNDVQHFEAARALAERVLAEGGAATSERLTYLYRTVLSRSPAAEELDLLTAALARQQELFAADPAGAALAIAVGESQPRRAAGDVEIAAWTMIANLVLNLDETLNRN